MFGLGMGEVLVLLVLALVLFGGAKLPQLARSLGKETVAEFIENAVVLQILREIGVTYGQGYYQGRAMRDLPSPGQDGAGLNPPNEC